MASATAWASSTARATIETKGFCVGSGTVRIELAGEADWYRLSVSDNGNGVTEADPERLFEMFYTTKPRGTGLGLSSSRRIAEAHGGRLQAARRQGWTVFTATLPVTAR